MLPSREPLREKEAFSIYQENQDQKRRRAPSSANENHCFSKKKVELMSHRKSVAEPRRASRGPQFHPNFSAFSPGSRTLESCWSSLSCQIVSHKQFDLQRAGSILCYVRRCPEFAILAVLRHRVKLLPGWCEHRVFAFEAACRNEAVAAALGCAYPDGAGDN